MTGAVLRRPHRQLQWPFRPPQLQYLQLWLKADDHGNSPLSAGATLSTWYDRSYMRNHATGGVPPTWEPSVLGGRSVVRFSGSQWLALAAPVGATNQPRTAIAVAKNTDAVNGSVIIGKSTESWGYLYMAPTYVLVWSNSDGTQSPTLSPDGQFRICEYVCDGINAKVGYDGNFGATESDNGIWTPERVGYYVTAASMMQGDIAEVLVWNRALTDGELQATRRYLADYYGLAGIRA